MLHDRRRPPIPLPKGWHRHVRSAVLHVLSLAQFAVAYTSGWAVNSIHARIRLKTEAEQGFTQMRDGLRVGITGLGLHLEGVGEGDELPLAVEVLANNRAFDLRDDREGSLVPGRHERVGHCIGGSWGWGSRRRSTSKLVGSCSRWRQVRKKLLRISWVGAPAQVRLPPNTFRFTTAGRIACSDQ